MSKETNKKVPLPPNFRKILKLNFQHLRKNFEGKGYSQTDFAEQVLKISVQQWNKWETGAQVPSLANIAKIAQATGLGWEWFLEDPLERELKGIKRVYVHGRQVLNGEVEMDGRRFPAKFYVDVD